MAAPSNTTLSTDVAPAISLDYTSRIRDNIDQLREMLGISEMIPMAAGNTINMYSLTRYNTPAQVAEGFEVPLTEIKRTVAKSVTLALLKYRKLTTAEAIQKTGADIAVNMTDAKLVSEVQKDIKAAFFTSVKTGTGTVTAGTTLQEQLANNWAAVAAGFEDQDCRPIHFINPADAAAYLGAANITIQNAFGMQYIEDFLGLGTVVLTTQVTATNVWSTAKENLCGFYAPVNGDLADQFGLSYDETGLIGMVHNAMTSHASIETLLMAGVVFCPEVLTKVYKGIITPASA